MLVKIYTDGAARGNPEGPGGYGTVLEYVDPKGNLHTREYSQGYKKTTNNRMELMAAITGLEALTRPCQVELYSDSKYLVDAFNQHWIDSWLKKGWKRGKNEPVKNVDLWKRLLAAKEPHQVTFIWVKGHDGHAQNERCDTLATTAADGQDLGPFLKFTLYGAISDVTVAQFYSGTPEELRRMDEVEKLIKEIYGDKVAVARSCPRIIDVQANGVNKAVSARRLQKELGRKILVCAGDAENDITMLDGADYAFVPADAVLKDRYENVCNCAEGAVAEVIYKKIPAILNLDLDKRG